MNLVLCPDQTEVAIYVILTSVPSIMLAVAAGDKIAVMACSE